MEDELLSSSALRRLRRWTEIHSSSALLRRRRRIEKKTKPKPSPSKNESFLPDDVIIEILRSLPSKDVVRSRCVCRRWSDLTSTRDFTNLHNSRRCSFPNPPMILKTYYLGMDLLDICWGTAQTTTYYNHKLKYHHRDTPYFSHNGLIVAQKGKDSDFPESGIIIYNPIYLETVKIIFPYGSSSVYGVFFHPILKEYCTLWRTILSFKPLKVQYRILNLESNPHWRDLKNPCIDNERIWHIPSVLIGEYLYWMAKPFEVYNVVEYDIRNEEFRVIPCPVNCNQLNYKSNMLDVDGVLSLVQVIPNIKLRQININIWTLKNHGEQLWTSFHYEVSSYLYSQWYGGCKAIAYWNGDLVLQCHYGILYPLEELMLYVCNLKLGTLRHQFGQTYRHDVKFFPHLTSLVSLRNCKSEIRMPEEDENNPRGKLHARGTQGELLYRED